MTDNEKLLIFLIILAGIFGYLWGIERANNSINELSNLKIRYTQLNESYYQEIKENTALRLENEQLKSQQKQLTEQIASYLLEQTTIDFIGLKKYNVAYDLLKIIMCNKIPSIPICY